MPPSDHLRYRQVLIDSMDALRDCSVQAERLYLRMAAGSHATRIGVILRPSDMTAECRMRPSEIQNALRELADAGLLLLSVSGSAYLVGHCANCCRRDAGVVSSWRDEAVRVLCGNRSDLLPQVLEDIDSVGAIAKPRDGKGAAKERDREKDKERDTTSTAAPAPDKPTPAKKEKCQSTVAQNPPTVEETCVLFREWLADHADWQGEKCWNYWKGSEWKRNGKPILDWKATCRTWAMNAIERGSRPVSGVSTAPQQAAPNDYKTIALQRDRRNDD